MIVPAHSLARISRQAHRSICALCPDAFEEQASDLCDRVSSRAVRAPAIARSPPRAPAARSVHPGLCRNKHSFPPDDQSLHRPASTARDDLKSGTGPSPEFVAIQPPKVLPVGEAVAAAAGLDRPVTAANL